MSQESPATTTDPASTTSTPTNPTGGNGGRGSGNRRERFRGGGREGRGGGNGNRGGRGHHRPNRPPKTPHSNFKGDTSDMNGHVFQCHSETSDAKQFSVTLEKLQHYVFKVFKNPTDIGGIFKDLEIPTIARPTKPVAPPPPDTKDLIAVADHEIDLSIFAEDVKDYVKRRNVLSENVKKLY